MSSLDDLIDAVELGPLADAVAEYSGAAELAIPELLEAATEYSRVLETMPPQAKQEVAMSKARDIVLALNHLRVGGYDPTTVMRAYLRAGFEQLEEADRG